MDSVEHVDAMAWLAVSFYAFTESPKETSLDGYALLHGCLKALVQPCSLPAPLN